LTSVFIGGSRAISRLSTEVTARIDRIMDQGFHVLVGDAYGADKAVQRRLDEVEYRNVTVFCAGSKCRNNVGHWATFGVAVRPRTRGFALFAAKDREMAEQADYGLMIWDGQSVGTLMNVWRLLRLNRKVVVYSRPDRGFAELTAWEAWSPFLASKGTEIASAFHEKMRQEPQYMRSRDELSSNLLGSAE